MRKIIVLSFITLDGVMQAPGGPEEDTSGNFGYGGWTVPYFLRDDFLGKTDVETLRIVVRQKDIRDLCILLAPA